METKKYLARGQNVHKLFDAEAARTCRAEGMAKGVKQGHFADKQKN